MTQPILEYAIASAAATSTLDLLHFSIQPVAHEVNPSEGQRHYTEVGVHHNAHEWPHQRDLLTLHGASLTFADKGILILGRSGAGKSTLAASLCARGGRLLSDDISAVRLGHTTADLLPGLPLQKLPKDTAAQLNLAPEALTPSFEDKWLVSQLSTYRPEPVPLHKIYLLRTRDATPLALTPLQGLPRLSAIMKNAFREKIIYAMQQQIRYSKQCFQLAETVPVSVIERPAAPIDVAALTERVVQDLMR